MRRTLGLCLIAAVLAAAVCGEPPRSAQTPPFPGPSELKKDPSFTVLVDGKSDRGNLFVVLGAQRTFSELRDDFIARLEANGWVEEPLPSPQASNDVFSARKGALCIDYWNMARGAWMAPGLRFEAARENPDFERQASGFTTVFNIALLECV